MLEQPLRMSSALRARARSLGFLMGYILFFHQTLSILLHYPANWKFTSTAALEANAKMHRLLVTFTHFIVNVEVMDVKNK